MKRLVSLLLILTMVITLTACKKKDDKNVAGKEPAANEVKTDTEKDTKSPTEPLEEKENPEEEVKETEDELTEEEKELQRSYEEQIKALISNSHYISIIKMTQTGAAGKEIHVIEDFKGSLKNIEFPEIKNLEANKDYLIFFRDSDTGDLIPTDSEKGIVELQGDDDQALKIVRDVLTPEPSEEKEKENK